MAANIASKDEQAAAVFSTSSPQTLASWYIDADSAGVRTIHISARRVSDGAAKSWIYEYAVKRDSGDGTLSGLNLISTKGTAADLVALATVSVSIDINGNDIEVNANGLASTAIDWAARQIGESVFHN